jgi:hypothetical protein
MDTPSFFVPAATPDNVDQVYASLAEMCRVHPPILGERIYRIAFVHDGTRWTATVGEQLRGHRTERRRRGGRLVESTSDFSDPATVLAIFPGSPYMVATNARPLGGIVSHWANPFMAGEPTGVRRFVD